jgi:NADP-dependent 3-hydroxy acid dehydrogenase YdfG
MTFTNKTFIITGASAGIGQALAIKLAQQGANLVLAAQNQTSLERTADTCIKAGGKAIAVPTDVTNSEACRNLIESAVDTFGAIAGLINNAGISMWARFDQVTFEIYQ